MACWSDLPTELKLLIVRHYIDRVLFTNLLGLPDTLPTNAAVEAATVQILSLATALPALRFHVLGDRLVNRGTVHQ